MAAYMQLLQLVILCFYEEQNDIETVSGLLKHHEYNWTIT